MTNSNKVLVVEDDTDISVLLRASLERIGLACELAHDGEQGLNLGLSCEFCAIVLDIMLPSLDGLEICRRLRAAKIYTPIMMLTSRADEIDRVLGIEVGADDYLSKPFSVREFEARIRALRRRAQHWSSNEEGNLRLAHGPLKMNLEKREAILAESSLQLTAKEFDLLWYFARNPGQVFNREQLLDKVWGYQSESYEHTVTAHINRLRTKLEGAHSVHKFFHTIRGAGYMFRHESKGGSPRE